MPFGRPVLPAVVVATVHITTYYKPPTHPPSTQYTTGEKLKLYSLAKRTNTPPAIHPAVGPIPSRVTGAHRHRLVLATKAAYGYRMRTHAKDSVVCWANGPQKSVGVLHTRAGIRRIFFNRMAYAVAAICTMCNFRLQVLV